MSRKRGLIIIAILFALLLALILPACQGGKSCLVIFYADGSEVTRYLVKKGASLDNIPDVPEKIGFAGVWDVGDDAFNEITKNMTVTAIYVKDGYTVSFYADGEFVTDRYVKTGRRLTDVPDVPQKDGFSGVWEITDFSLIDRDVRVNAVYTKKMLSVRFFVGEETQAFASREVSLGADISNMPAVPSHAYKNYSGKWTTVSGEAFIDFDGKNVLHDTDVYAYYYITLQIFGGEKERLELDLENEIFEEDLTHAEVFGKRFIGWYFDDAFTKKVAFPLVLEENSAVFARFVTDYYDEAFVFSGSTVTGYLGALTEVVIPFETPYGTLVTKIADNAFKNSAFTSVTIPSTVTEIGASAFEGCASLSEIIFADKSYVEKIGERAFKETAIATFTVSRFLKEIGAQAFYNCAYLSSLTDLELSVLIKIGEGAFEGASYLGVNKGAEVRLPETISIIGARAFFDLHYTLFIFSGLSNVTEVGESAFENCFFLEGFFAPNVNFIGVKAFAGCRNLTEVSLIASMRLYELFGTENVGGDTYTVVGRYIPASLIRVAVAGEGTLIENAFYNMTSVKRVIFTGTITEIDGLAFLIDDGRLDVSTALEIIFNSSLVSINDEAFLTRNDIRTMEIPLYVEAIGARAFADIALLTNVTLSPLNVAFNFVGKDAFKGTAFLKSGQPSVVTLGKIVVGANDAMRQRTVLNSGDFKSATTIGEWALSNWGGLAEVTLSPNIISVSSFAFANNGGLLTVRFPSSCLDVAENVFASCPNLASLEVGYGLEIAPLFSGTYPASFIELTVLFNGTEVFSGIYSGELPTVKTIRLGEGFTEVSDNAFNDLAELLAVYFPSTLIILGKDLFVGSPLLVTAVAADNSALLTIGENAFKDTNLSAFNVTSEVEEIGAYAFYNTKLTSLTFASRTKTLNIRSFAFAQNPLLETVSLPTHTSLIADHAFYACVSLTEISLPEGLKTIGNYAFENCALQSFTLPSTVQAASATRYMIGILKGNLNLTEITLYNGYFSIAKLFDNGACNINKVRLLGGTVSNAMFKNMTSLQSVDLINIGGIGENAFFGCVNLHLPITVPSSAVFIGNNAFSECSSLTRLFFEENSRLEALGENVFSGCRSLQFVSFPSNALIENFVGVFSGCESLTSVSLPGGIRVIGDNAFLNCGDLTSIDNFPENLEAIGLSAFKNCAKLLFAVQNFARLTDIGESAFEGCLRLSGVKADNLETASVNAFKNCPALTEITLAPLSDIFEALPYVNAVQITVINLSSKLQAIASNVLNAFTHLEIIAIESDFADAILTSMLTSVLPSNAVIFIKAELFSNLSSAITSSTLYSKIFPSPVDFLSVTYVYDEENSTAILSAAQFKSGTKLAYLPKSVAHNGKTYTVNALGENAFYGSSIEKIFIPSTLEIIGARAFAECTSLTTVIFETGSRLSIIGEGAFFNAGNLNSFAIMSKVSIISEWAFSRSGIKTFTVSASGSVSKVMSHAFSGCASLDVAAAKEALSDANVAIDAFD